MKLRFYIFAALITIIFSSSCVPTRHLGENERLLYKIKLDGVNQSDPERIASLYQQQPNRKILGSMPYLSLYYFGRRFYDPKKIEKKIVVQRAQMDKRIAAAGDDSLRVNKLLVKKERKLARLTHRLEEGNALMIAGEPPVLYDSVKTQNTIQQISTYLNSKGFFKNQVSYTTSEKNKKVTLQIKVQENIPYTYSQVNYVIQDSAIQKIVAANRSGGLVRVNQQYDEEVLINERNRLELLLKNSGYFYFQKQYIIAEPDTSFEENQVRLAILINNDSNGQPHQVFRISRINFIPDNRVRFGLKYDTIFYNNIYYLAYRHRISPRIIDKKILIRPGQLYNLNHTLLTQQQLTSLDMFRFLNINWVASDSALVANISASPSKRFQETTEGGLSYSARLPGPFTNFRLVARNIFGGAELLEIGLRGGLEGQIELLNVNRSVYTSELGGNVAFVFPQFLIPFIANQYFTSYTPRTRLNLNYTYLNRQEFTRINQETSLDYVWQKSQQLQYIFTPFDISINNSNLSESFRKRLEVARPPSGTPTTYERSFDPSFVSSLNFTRLFNNNNYNHTLDANYLRVFVEEAGILGKPLFGRFFEGSNLTLFQFARFIIDYRRYHKLSNSSFFVTRFNFGASRSLNGNNVLPYDRYFYAGGGTSNRAFRPRRLGPGSFLPLRKDDNGNEIRDEDSEQQGELLIETNLEYRFNMWSFVNGALFIDAGNIWMMTEDEARPGSRFEIKDFYKELAIGTGFGFRFDFTFLIARVDVATKVYDPALPLRDRFVLGKFNSNNLLGRNILINLGIGYPF